MNNNVCRLTVTFRCQNVQEIQERKLKGKVELITTKKNWKQTKSFGPENLMQNKLSIVKGYKSVLFCVIAPVGRSTLLKQHTKYSNCTRRYIIHDKPLGFITN